MPLQVKYEGKVNGALGTLQSLRAEIHHNVDATVSACSYLTIRIDERLQTLSDYEFTHLPDGSPRKFDRIVFNVWNCSCVELWVDERPFSSPVSGCWRSSRSRRWRYVAALPSTAG